MKASLHHERTERQQVELQLQAEKEARARDLNDIARECRDPFVVPALLDAFLKLSKMSNDIL